MGASIFLLTCGSYLNSLDNSFHYDDFHSIVNNINILPAYKLYLQHSKQEKAPDFYGKNIKCVGLKQEDHASMSSMCGGFLWNHTQHYAYNIVAQHTLAVC